MARPEALLWMQAISGSKPVRAITQNNDVALAVFMLMIVALFVLPLPPAALDAMVSINIGVSILLLTVSLYISSPLSLSTFPSMLLFTTLLRLSLNIASCKLILLRAEAGHVIETFGRLVVGNNVLVGGVVFMIIAIVQFIVIAKGSERVAEVGARFSLDAMPGKQMSIDADLRAGLLTADEAKRRRRALEEESQLHGAMDGAMKFVKGDAIAGIVIAMVNILAGIAVGTLQHDMSVSDALARYAILTVGDGMASQIPSLLMSIAAGIVITRVGGGAESHNRHLGEQMGVQVLAHPRALLIAGGVLCSFAVVQGFPKWSFGGLGLGLGATGLVLLRRRKEAPDTGLLVVEDVEEASGPAVPAVARMSNLLQIRLAADARPRVDNVRLHAALLEARARVEATVGPVFPRVHLSFGRDLPAATYWVYVQDVAVAQGEVPANAVPTTAPDATGGTTEQALASAVESVVHQHATSLVGLQETQNIVQIVRREWPELAGEVTRVIPLSRLCEVLNRLLSEGIPVRNLRSIFESVANWAPKEPDVIALVEDVRAGLRSYITQRYCGPQRRLHVFLLEGHLEERIAAAKEEMPRGTRLALPQSVFQHVQQQLGHLLTQVPPGVTPVVLAPMGIRRYVKKLIEPAHRALAVLSYQEIERDVELMTLGWVVNPPEGLLPEEGRA